MIAVVASHVVAGDRSTVTGIAAGSFNRYLREAIIFGYFSRIKKLLGRTETRTRDRMDCHSIRPV